MWVSLSDIAPTTPFGCFHMYYDQQSWQSTVFFIQFILMLIEMQSWHEYLQSSICSHTWLCLCWLQGLAAALRCYLACSPRRKAEEAIYLKKSTWQFCERDLFGDGENVTLSRVKWPPTRGSKGHFEELNRLAHGNVYMIHVIGSLMTYFDTFKRAIHSNLAVQLLRLACQVGERSDLRIRPGGSELWNFRGVSRNWSFGYWIKQTYPPGNDHISLKNGILSRWFSELPKVGYVNFCGGVSICIMIYTTMKSRLGFFSLLAWPAWRPWFWDRPKPLIIIWLSLISNIHIKGRWFSTRKFFGDGSILDDISSVRGFENLVSLSHLTGFEECIQVFQIKRPLE